MLESNCFDDNVTMVTPVLALLPVERCIMLTVAGPQIYGWVWCMRVDSLTAGSFDLACLLWHDTDGSPAHVTNMNPFLLMRVHHTGLGVIDAWAYRSADQRALFNLHEAGVCREAALWQEAETKSDANYKGSLFTPCFLTVSWTDRVQYKDDSVLKRFGNSRVPLNKQLEEK